MVVAGPLAGTSRHASERPCRAFPNNKNDSHALKGYLVYTAPELRPIHAYDDDLAALSVLPVSPMQQAALTKLGGPKVLAVARRVFIDVRIAKDRVDQ